MNNKEKDEILAHSITKTHPKGRILVQQGDMPQHLYYIISGSLITFRSNNEGAINAIRLLSKGETCMDAVIFMESSSPIGVQAVKNSEVLHIDRAFVQDFAARNIKFAGNLLHIVAKYYKDALYQLDGLSIKPAMQRTGYYLLHNYLENNSENFVMQFNRYLVASHLGMSFETLSRTLAGIKKLGVVIKGNNVTLTDKHALCSFCDDNTAEICRFKSDKCSQIRLRQT